MENIRIIVIAKGLGFPLLLGLLLLAEGMDVRFATTLRLAHYWALLGV